MFQALNKIATNIKQKPALIYGICCVALLPVSFFIIYYFRVLYEPVWLGQMEFTLYLFIALCLLFSLLFFLVKNYKNKPELTLSAIIFIICAAFALTTPINQVPDENVHYLRAQTMAQGQFGFDEHHEFPRDSMVLMESFPNMFLNGHNYSIANKYTQYFETLENEEYTPPQIGIIIFQVFAYIPQTIGIFFANVLGLNAMAAFYFARIFNVLFFSLCAYFSFVFSGRFKILLFTVMCIPISSYSIGSINTDSVLFALLFLALSVLLSDKVNLKKVIIFAFCMAILIVSKASYVVFLPLLFFVNKQRWAVKLKKYNISKTMLFIATLVVCVLVYQFMALYVEAFSNYGVIERTIEASNPSLQLAFMLSNPLRFAVIFVDVLLDNSFFIFNGGLFGWIYANIDIISNLAVVMFLINVFKQSNVVKKEDKSIIYGFALTSILTYAVVVAGLYLSWAPVGHIEIIGLQMRYFIPAIIGAVLFMAHYFNRFTKKDANNTDVSCICSMYVLNIFAVILQLSLYYLI